MVKSAPIPIKCFDPTTTNYASIRTMCYTVKSSMYLKAHIINPHHLSLWFGTGNWYDGAGNPSVRHTLIPVVPHKTFRNKSNFLFCKVKYLLCICWWRLNCRSIRGISQYAKVLTHGTWVVVACGKQKETWVGENGTRVKMEEVKLIVGILLLNPGSKGGLHTWAIF